MSSGREFAGLILNKMLPLLPVTGLPFVASLIHSVHKTELMASFVQGTALMVWTQDRFCLCVLCSYRENRYVELWGQSHPSPKEA